MTDKTDRAEAQLTELEKEAVHNGAILIRYEKDDIPSKVRALAEGLSLALGTTVVLNDEQYLPKSPKEMN